MTLTIVGTGDCVVSNDITATLITYGLGSCIGITAWDPIARVSGLVHYLLPDSAMDLTRSRRNPWLCADTAIPALIDACVRSGAMRSRLILRAAGGAQIMDEMGFFSIGQRNSGSMRDVLARSGMRLHAEVTGGSVSRHLRIETGSGRCWVDEPGETRELLAVSVAGTIR